MQYLWTEEKHTTVDGNGLKNVLKIYVVLRAVAGGSEQFYRVMYKVRWRNKPVD